MARESDYLEGRSGSCSEQSWKRKKADAGYSVGKEPSLKW